MNTFFYIYVFTKRCGIPEYEWGPYLELADAVKALELLDTILKIKEYSYTIGEYFMNEHGSRALVDDKIYGEVNNA